ncbi:uncharacterized protein LOC112348921 [Selaginella moellendorffii]|uniref:uncharacterized protein LOC112348921 n=1 Tax=Selaginella moellendorffii TaxID=88036 RepID=UPI000D1C8F05|nr:uncharacterized protein LOC112348921 [Selaginella moellendorffii]|eukprot:XP_024538060.1 uncharacterized protein LOC112348921 [Selaginella moellendorffii]
MAKEAASAEAVANVPGLRHTVWDQDQQLPKYPRIAKDESADVVVVGAGIAGMNVAYNLIKEGKSVIVLEGRTRGSGQTGRTTAHIMPWNDDFYYMLEQQHGAQVVKHVAESHRSAIEWVANTVQEEKLDCHFKRLDGYLFPCNESSTEHDKLQKEFEACKKFGFDSVELVDLGGDPSVGKIHKALRFPDAAEFHPLMYINGLAEAFVRRGGKIYEISRVMEIDGGSQVKTADGVSVSTGAVVVATNSPLNHDLFVHARQAASHSYVVGLKVPKGSVRTAEWWDTDSPYHYVRLEEKDGYDVLIVGGGDTSTGMKPSEYKDTYGELANWARARWTSAQEVLYTWTGQVFEPADKLHLIGLEPLESLKGSNQYIVTGDSGQGMTGGTIAGILIRDLILGRPNPWAAVYSPKRLLPLDVSTIKSTVEEANHTFQGLKDTVPFLGTDSVDIEDLQTSHGAVIQTGLHKVAVYKDGNGRVHRHSAVCPHMKCIVKWNPVDSTFDCPCHGSIFDPYGKVINGPAKADLFEI